MIAHEKRLRICQMIAVRDGLNSWGSVTQEIVNDTVSDDIEVVIRDLPESPVSSVMSGSDCEKVAPFNVEAAIQAEKDGFDAITTGCLLDPGLSQMKKQTKNIIVVGDCEAVMTMGSMLGSKISLLMPSKKGSGLIEEGSGGTAAVIDLIKRYGHAKNLCSVRGISSTSLDFAERKARLPELMLEQANQAITVDGADVIMGYGSLDVITHLRKNLSVPVLESIECTLAMAATLVKLKSSSVKSVS